MINFIEININGRFISREIFELKPYDTYFICRRFIHDKRHKDVLSCIFLKYTYIGKK